VESILKLEEVMTTKVVSVEMDCSLKLIKEVFDSASFHHLLVVEDAELVGVISDRDLLRAIGPRVGTVAETAAEVAELNRKAHQIMTRRPITLRPNNDIKVAIGVFNKHSISCIPIVDAKNKPVGIVSWRDILKTL